jgi:hypothetical protein
LVAYWNFDDSVTWMNPAYGGQTTTVGSGTPTRDNSTKKFGDGSLYLNGGSYLKIDNPGEWLPAGSSAYSISLWFRAPSLNPWFVIIFWGISGTNNAVGIHTTSWTGGIQNYWYNNDLQCAVSDCPLTTNTWYHVVATFDGTNHKTYLNGVLKASRTASNKATTRLNFYVGREVNGNPFNGYIDDLGIYNRALTLTEVQILYNSSIMPDSIYQTATNSVNQINQTNANLINLTTDRNDEMFSYRAKIVKLEADVNDIKTNITHILLEISKINISIRKLSATDALVKGL